MSSKLATCALGINLLGWIAVANERLAIITTSFFHVYFYAAGVFAIAAVSLILAARTLGPTIEERPSDWHLEIFAAVPNHARILFGVLAGGAIAYLFLMTGGNASAESWESAGPVLRSAVFSGFSIPAALAWIALLAASKAAA